jgi:hypothetical protein
MKKIIILFVAALGMIGCGKKQSAEVDTSRFEGKYEIDFQTMVDEAFGDSKGEKAAKAVANFMVKRLHVSMEFDGENLTIDASDLAKKFVNKIADGETMPIVTRYEIRNDSVLWTFDKDDNKFERAGILRHEKGNFQRIDINEETDDPDDDEFDKIILKKIG